MSFAKFRRKQIAELRPYVVGEDISGFSLTQEDAKAGSPKPGDMIARNPKNHADQWIVSAAYFADNFEPIDTAPPTPRAAYRQPTMSDAQAALVKFTDLNENIATSSDDCMLAALNSIGVVIAEEVPK
jgi:hypothetical protein